MDLEKLYSHEIELKLLSEGYRTIAGIDEAGRGALAGPVVAACVIPGHCLDTEGINDSKKLTPGRRKELNIRIFKNALAIGIGIVEAAEIDKTNILAATMKAMQIALFDCIPYPDAVIVDGNRGFSADIPIVPLVKGDSLSVAVAAASIVAKVKRDSIMEILSGTIKGYGFEKHKGYGTAIHLEAIRAMGPSEEHRRTFAPLSKRHQGSLFDGKEGSTS